MGSISIPIYAHTNIIPQRDPQTGAILYDSLPDGKRKARVKYQSDIYTVAYYAGHEARAAKILRSGESPARGGIDRHKTCQWRIRSP